MQKLFLLYRGKSKRFEMLPIASVSNGLTKFPCKGSCGAHWKNSPEKVTEETHGWDTISAGSRAILHNALIRRGGAGWLDVK